MHTIIIASVLVVSAPAQTEFDRALYRELMALQDELSRVHSMTFKGYGDLSKCIQERSFEFDSSLAEKWAVTSQMARIADHAAPHGKRVAQYFNRTFLQVRPELQWQGLHKEFQDRYFTMFVKPRITARTRKWVELIAHRWAWEADEGWGFNSTCYVYVSLLCRSHPKADRQALLTQWATWEVIFFDSWVSLTTPKIERVAQGR